MNEDRTERYAKLVRSKNSVKEKGVIVRMLPLNWIRYDKDSDPCVKPLQLVLVEYAGHRGLEHDPTDKTLPTDADFKWPMENSPSQKFRHLALLPISTLKAAGTIKNGEILPKFTNSAIVNDPRTYENGKLAIQALIRDVKSNGVPSLYAPSLNDLFKVNSRTNRDEKFYRDARQASKNYCNKMQLTRLDLPLFMDFGYMICHDMETSILSRTWYDEKRNNHKCMADFDLSLRAAFFNFTEEVRISETEDGDISQIAPKKRKRSTKRKNSMKN